tara:strand:- start:28264 stop:28482 length:219 start_codon:yes stop_codon:yes gene_type:complete
MTKYLKTFVVKMVEHYIPKGIDPFTHLNSRAFMYDLVIEKIESKEFPPKLAIIKYLLENYKKVIYTKLSKLN